MSLLFSLLITIQARAATVAFIEHLDARGEIVALDQGGRFYHSALEIDGQWLQSHPYRGVELVSFNEIEKQGCVALTIEIPDSLIDRAELRKDLGKPFDHEFLWDDSKLYCSEVIAKVLGIPPEPMVFDPKVWPSQFAKYNGLPGLSPDDVARYLLARGFRSHEIRCR